MGRAPLHPWQTEGGHAWRRGRGEHRAVCPGGLKAMSGPEQRVLGWEGGARSTGKCSAAKAGRSLQSTGNQGDAVNNVDVRGATPYELLQKVAQPCL